MFDTLDILNLHLFIRETYIFVMMSGHHFAVEDRGASAVTHLAHARSQNSRTGILGYMTGYKSSSDATLFLCNRKLRCNFLLHKKRDPRMRRPRRWS